jgi:single-strand DNA-binding protein
MNNLNSVLIEGNLTQDPQTNVLPSGKSVCRFSIASNRYYRNPAKELINEVSYIDIDTWGSLAEGCAKYLHKGRGVRIVGRLKQERWQTDDGKTHDKHIVVAEHVEFHPESRPAEEDAGEEQTLTADPVEEEAPQAERKGKRSQR